MLCAVLKNVFFGVFFVDLFSSLRVGQEACVSCGVSGISGLQIGSRDENEDLL